ncbi:MAG: hypothetical protein ACYC0J_10240, partial [Gammaproteobacteria bacterium]
LLNAASVDEYYQHMAHLREFIQQLSKVDVFATNSNDRTYLSLITLVEHLQEEQFKQDLSKLRENILNQMKESMININQACSRVMADVHENILFTTTLATPALYQQYKS